MQRTLSAALAFLVLCTLPFLIAHIGYMSRISSFIESGDKSLLGMMIYRTTFVTVVDAVMVVIAFSVFLLLTGRFRRDRFFWGLWVALPVLIVCRIGATLLDFYGLPRVAGVLTFWMTLLLCLLLSIWATYNGGTHRMAAQG